jgi:hypothetical protein
MSDFKSNASESNAFESNAFESNAFEFNKLREHIGHHIECVCYADGENVYNVALECEDCGMVLHDVNHPEVDDQPIPYVVK